MSNLYKRAMIVCDTESKRVIDYNSIISEKLVNINKELSKEENSGFSFGLNSQSVDEALREGKIVGSVTDDEDENNQINGNSHAVSGAVADAGTDAENILSEARSKAEEILRQANEDAEAIIKKATKEADDIRNRAVEEGIEEGVAQGKDRVSQLEKEKLSEYENLKNQLEDQYQKKMAEMEPALVDVILKLFAEITHAVSEDEKDMILTLVNNVVAGNEVSRNFIIRVSKEDARFLRDNKERIIGAVRKDVSIEIVEDASMNRNQCLIDTDIGVFDCGLDIQLENLIHDIKILSCTGE